METQLSPENERFVEAQVHSGRFPDRATVLEEAVRLMRERQCRLAELREQVQHGIASGEGVQAEQVLRRLEAKASELGRKAR